MEKTGSRCDLIFYEGQPHGFFNLKKGGPKIYAETFYDMDLFLTSLGYLEGPPTIDIPKEDDI